MILTTGFPKSGTHALVKAVQLLGHPCQVDHMPHTEYAGAWPGPRIVIKRDPRNVLLSWVRHQGKPVTRGMAITFMRDYDAGQTLAQAMAPFEGWLSDPGALLVSYEALTASDDEMRRIAAHLDTPYIDDAWRWLPGMTRTWRADHSDWEALWTPQMDAAWREIGGPELLDRWGY